MARADFASLALTFAVTRVDRGTGEVTTHELCVGGAEKDVTKDNLNAFLGLRLKHSVFDSHKQGLLALLAGFYEVVPPACMLLVTARELELVLCGTPALDVSDWKEHTLLRGDFENKPAHPCVSAFWRCVESWTDEQRARLLQWATGSSRLPVGGFKHLQQRDGASRLFTLTSVPGSTASYPRAHTCFNRIDIPLYSRPHDELPAALLFVIQNFTGGFSMD
ncbi:hypothetical protein M885DRAFT_513415 [Pelagophyceae sp. CCMP2097]|nr:hypothetical protein M885DRAFT_513415 [Pelagophyceae sp. CCMP2097]